MSCTSIQSTGSVLSLLLPSPTLIALHSAVVHAHVLHLSGAAEVIDKIQFGRIVICRLHSRLGSAGYIRISGSISSRRSHQQTETDRIIPFYCSRRQRS
ncbi:hypothetical protein BDR05DRAFT_1059017 [Suillus weaverae]|nr:hypothetical protein BDR05DRAFT_1059017 [Suillus weaverae]